MARKLPDTKADREIVAQIKSALVLRGLEEKDLLESLHMCRSTFDTRMKNPGEFKLNELRIIQKRLKCDLLGGET